MKKVHKTILFIAIPVAVAAAVIAYNYFTGDKVGDGPASEKQAAAPKGGGGAGRTIPVNVFVVDYLHTTEGITVIGTLLPNEEVDMASEVAGKVETISFQEGGRVKKGQVLVQINDDDLQSQLRRATFQRNLLKEKLDRSRILLEKDAISREAFDQIETDYNMVETDIQLLQVRIEKTSIKAPFDGVAGFRYVAPGSYIQPGTKIVHLVDYSSLKIEFSMPERYYRESLLGTSILFSTESDKQQRSARIYAVNPTVDVSTRSVQMRAIYPNNTMRVIPGMYSRVVVGRKSGTSLQVPTEAIVPDAANKKVWLVRGGKAHLQDVMTGTRSETMVEITAGIVPGDSVVITGLMQMKEGAQLIINN